VSDVDAAAGVLRGDDGGLTDAERALAGWARLVARNPNGIGPADVRVLRDAVTYGRPIVDLDAQVSR